MKKVIQKIGGIIVILLIVGYFICLYPLIVEVKDGETRCKSLVGFTIKCD